MRRGMTNSEVEKKKKGDVSRNAFTMPMLRASTLSILDSIVMFEYVVVDDDALQDQEAAVQHPENPGSRRASLGEKSTAKGFFLKNYHKSYLSYHIRSV